MTRLWTVQREVAWHLAQERGELRADGRRICWEYFRPSYHWMMERMREHIPGYQGRFPIWAWEHKIDLRLNCLLPRGTSGVRIAFEANEGTFLRSSFKHWHSILNNTLLSLSQEEWDTWIEAGEPQEAMRQSWERVFDLETIARAHQTESEWLGSLGHTQAVLERVPLNRVRKVDYFTAR